VATALNASPKEVVPPFPKSGGGAAGATGGGKMPEACAIGAGSAAGASGGGCEAGGIAGGADAALAAAVPPSGESLGAAALAECSQSNGAVSCTIAKADAAPLMPMALSNSLRGARAHKRHWASRILVQVVALNVSACLSVAPAVPSVSGAANPTNSLFNPSWVWRDEHGTLVSLSRWQGAPTVVSAIYTSCTSRCPMTLQKLRTIDEAYRAAGLPAEFVLVTLDPRTDTPGRLRQFKASRDLPDRWHLLSGDETETHQIARFLGARAAFGDGHIDHDARISVFDAYGRLVRTVEGWDFDVATMVIR
jgi:cytochrome oxidase Cu insertion factor (SCO1/SenC/PrrC family)